MATVKFEVGNDGPDPVTDATVLVSGLDTLTVNNVTVSKGTWAPPVWTVGMLGLGQTATITLDVSNFTEEEVVIAVEIASANEDPNDSNNISAFIVGMDPIPATFSLYPRLALQEYGAVTLFLDEATSQVIGNTSSTYYKSAFHVESALAVWPDIGNQGFWIYDGRAGNLIQVNDGVSFYAQASFSPSGDKILIQHDTGQVTVPIIYNRAGQRIMEPEIESGSGLVMMGENDLVYAKWQSDGIYWHDLVGSNEMRLLLFSDVTLNRMLYSDGQDFWFLNDSSGVYSIAKFDMNTEEVSMQEVPGYVQNFSVVGNLMVVTFESAFKVGVYDLDACTLLKEYSFDPSMYSPHGAVTPSGHVVTFWAQNPPEGGAPAVNYAVYALDDLNTPIETGLTGQDFNTYQGYQQTFLAAPVLEP